MIWTYAIAHIEVQIWCGYTSVDRRRSRLTVRSRLHSTVLLVLLEAIGVHRCNRSLRRRCWPIGWGVGGWCSTSVEIRGRSFLCGPLSSMSTFLQKNPVNAIEYTFAFSPFVSFFFFGFALLVCDGVGGAAVPCCGDDGWVRPLAVVFAAGADGGGIAPCRGVPIFC